MDASTVKELVETCGVTHQTFYYHFQDIYQLLEWLMSRMKEEPEAIVSRLSIVLSGVFPEAVNQSLETT